MSEKPLDVQGFCEYTGQRYEVLKELADCCTALGDYTEAVEHYRQAIRLQPRKAEAYTGLGLLAIRTGQLALAQEMLTTAASLDPQAHDAWGGLAVMHQKLGDLESAWLMYRRCLDLHAEEPTFLVGFFQTAWKLGRLAPARPVLEAYVARHPEDASVAYCLGLLLARLAEPAGAQQVLRTALSHCPDHPQAQALLVKVQALLTQQTERAAS